jgi:hypothetical protein
MIRRKPPNPKRRIQISLTCGPYMAPAWEIRTFGTVANRPGWGTRTDITDLARAWADLPRAVAYYRACRRMRGGR